MLIVLAAPVLLFLLGWAVMILNEEKCVKRDESATIISRKRNPFH
jgi:hypothetical protein